MTSAIFPANVIALPVWSHIAKLKICPTCFKSTLQLRNSAMPRRNVADFEVDGDDCLKSYQYVFEKDLLKDKVALITGGGSGIGFRITELFMRHGCKTAIASRKLDRVKKAAEKLEKTTGVRCLPLQVDVRNPAQLQEVLSDILSHFGRLDILVNNAAGNFLCPAESLSYNAFKTVMEIDTFGTFNTTKAAFEKHFKNHGGSIINISSTLQYKGSILQTHAGSAKAAIDAMTRHLAVEWGPKGIRVNGIAPGPIAGTEGFKRIGGEDAKKAARNIPLMRMGYKTEIAECAVFLASDASSYITGTVQIVDGGSWMCGANPPDYMSVFKSKM